MRTILLVNTGNDADIIDESLTHNAKYFDKIIVMDHESKDGTLEIIEKNHPNIFVRKMGDFYPEQLPILNQALLTIYQDDFDYFVILDADEFIVADSLKEFQTIPKGQVGIIPWKCYVPEHDVYSDFKKNITKRRTIEHEHYHKVVVPTDTKCILKLGNHYVLDYDLSIYNTFVELNYITLKTISIAHFPVRSIKQYNKKIEFFTNLNRDNLKPEELNHVKNEKIISSEKELKEKAMHYGGIIEGQSLVDDPVK